MSFVLLMVLSASLRAEVTHSSEYGFATVNEVIVTAQRADVWNAAVDQVGSWWSPDHTISGDASRLSISAVPQGCFCESFGAGAGVVHLSVTMVNPANVIRLSGGLGPLGLLGVSGNMTWEFESVGDATRVRFTYVVGGYSPAGLSAIAAPVDRVIADALGRLQRFAQTGAADDAQTEESASIG